jgi:hypothetical protein
MKISELVWEQTIPVGSTGSTPNPAPVSTVSNQPSDKPAAVTSPQTQQTTTSTTTTPTTGTPPVGQPTIGKPPVGQSTTGNPQQQALPGLNDQELTQLTNLLNKLKTAAE